MPATEQELFDRLAELDIECTTYRHPAVWTVEESKRLRGDIPGGHCKSLFLKDKKGMVYLVVALEDREIDMKRFAQADRGRAAFVRTARTADGDTRRDPGSRYGRSG